MLNAPQFQIYQVDDVYYLLSTNGPDYITQYLRQGMVWEKWNLELTKLFLDNIENPVVFDIGANLGAWSVPIAKYLKPIGGRVFSFEPQRNVFQQLSANLLLNGLSNCYAYNMALGNHKTVLQIPLLNMHRSNNLGALSMDGDITKLFEREGFRYIFDETQSVECNSLNLLGFTPPREGGQTLPKVSQVHFIKLDVEGWELEVLQGADQFLAHVGFPPILLEIWSPRHRPEMISKREQLLAFLHELGYQTTEFGESCLAQHKSHLRFNFRVEEGLLYFEPIS